MARIGLIATSLLAAGVLFCAARANACPVKAAEPTRKLPLPIERKAPRIFTPSQATKQGKLDDRLIRPHRTYDASAGVLG